MFVTKRDLSKVAPPRQVEAPAYAFACGAASTAAAAGGCPMHAAAPAAAAAAAGVAPASVGSSIGGSPLR